MSMNEVIRQRRKELNYTQEQIADQLGVSIPAVSKWESGATYPDVESLPAIARVLKIDVNTLLCFKMELTEMEIGNLTKEVYEIATSEGIEKAFLLAEQKMQEYPTDIRLIHTLAITLQGLMMMTKMDDSAKDTYDLKMQNMYERVGNSGDSQYADRANYMLASRAIRDKKYEKAQELLDRLPDYRDLDKKIIQANLWMETGKEKEAGKIYASKIISGMNQIQIPLERLIEVAVKNGDTENAEQLVQCGQALTKAFGMWEYNTHIFAFEKAMDEKNAAETIKVLEQMLKAMLVPWDISNCPVYKYIGNDKQEMDLGKKMFANVLEELEKSEKYDFLREEEAFQQLLDKYAKEEIE